MDIYTNLLKGNKIKAQNEIDPYMEEEYKKLFI